ncbi:MAG: ribonuclease H-like domain-containing protein [Chloroflexota bacterium]
MPPSLSDKLKNLGVKVGAKELEHPAGPPILQQLYGVDRLIPGRVTANAGGETYVVETMYTTNIQHGRSDLNLDTPFDTLAAWVKEERIATASPEDFAFLDIETTGLSGGTGTYAFLVGVGRYTGEVYHLAQFFLRDPSEEEAQLLALEAFLAPCSILVTFNGKSFDAPLLNTRYAAHGWRSPLPQIASLDLLHLARRLWRDRLPSRTLGALEAQILGHHRSEEDVPGWLVPQMYFDYLHTGDARLLRGVFYHNAVDVLSLAALLKHVAALLNDPLNGSVQNALDWPALGRLFTDLGQEETAVTLFQRALACVLPRELYNQTQHDLSFLYKRRGESDQAVALWLQAAQEGAIYACVELAKLYEHEHHDLPRALHWTQFALDRLLSPGAQAAERFAWQNELSHRCQRLLRKIASQNSG